MKMKSQTFDFFSRMRCFFWNWANEFYIFKLCSSKISKKMFYFKIHFRYLLIYKKNTANAQWIIDNATKHSTFKIGQGVCYTILYEILNSLWEFKIGSLLFNFLYIFIMHIQNVRAKLQLIIYFKRFIESIISIRILSKLNTPAFFLNSK